MYNICSEYSDKFKLIIHKILNSVFADFIEIGSHLDYDEIYGSVFPLHLQDNENYGKDFLRKLNINIIDGFKHEIKALDEYVLYHIFLFLYEGSDDGYILTDTVNHYISEVSEPNLNNDELRVLKEIETPYDLIGICFEDVDFLDVGELIELYKLNPWIITHFLHVDLEYYVDLMPNDILLEYNKIKGNKKPQDLINSKLNNKSEFYKIISSLVE